MGTCGTNGSYSGYVRKTSPGGAIGAAKLLKVMSGDQINTSVDYYWPSATVNNTHADGIGTLTTSLLSVLLNTAGVSASVKGATTAVNTGLTADPNMVSKLTTPENNSSGSAQPKAYLHVLLFNEQFQFDNTNSYVLQIKNTPNVKDNLAQVVTVKRNGYAYIYFSNESDNDVYFDNFKLTDVRGQILQESHYNPWGEKLSGISSQAMSFGGTTNRYLYNGKEQQAGEFSDGTGLENYDYGARMYDDQIGRWNVIDPLSDRSRRWSTYNYAYDNPTRFIDPDGMEGQEAQNDANDDETVRVKYLLNTRTGDITTQEVSEEEYDQATNDGTENVVSDNSESSGSNDKQITINGINSADNKIAPILKINNPLISATVNTSLSIPKGFGPITFNFSDFMKGKDALMISLTGDIVGFGGGGVAYDFVLLLKGENKGMYSYRALDVDLGVNLGIGLMAGGIKFNPDINAKDIGPNSFEGWSFSASVGLGLASAAYVRAFSDAEQHIPGAPGNPPTLYSGWLFGCGLSKADVGGMVTWSNAALIPSWSKRF